MALWPLVAVAVTQNHLARVVTLLPLLLDPSQLHVPDLANLIEQAMQHWDSGHPQETHTLLQQAVTQAEQLRYL
jgi:hypothetical protein